MIGGGGGGVGAGTVAEVGLVGDAPPPPQAETVRLKAVIAVILYKNGV